MDKILPIRNNANALKQRIDEIVEINPDKYKDKEAQIAQQMQVQLDSLKKEFTKVLSSLSLEEKQQRKKEIEEIEKNLAHIFRRIVVLSLS